ncbi:alkaline phosphatase [Altibacter sp.]|uniref:alkaline phosphatase n=1 Tax=Altibacter sp. TaxID=2024823 RepID=UPI002590FF1D|nr:alkaline phosphatase [Altibacter sp.]MCW9036802.1 alkaline phosphatase [Altibacter sp.]
MNHLLSLLCALLFLLKSASFFAQIPSDNINNETTGKPKNIILLIGDGMGLSQVSAGFFYSDRPSNFEQFPVVGLLKTSASSDLITDSAASGTAYASGIKTYNGAIGMTQDTLAAKTIVELVSERDMSTGLIATSSITHATPASFYAHVASRRSYEAIATFLPQSDVDFFAGGGLKFFSERQDGRDLISELEQHGFELSTQSLPKQPSEKKQAILLAKDALPTMLEGRGDFLPAATQLALKHLSKNTNGFFLMVEGSQIDWGGHSNDADYLIAEQLDFDKTIGVVLAYIEENPNTLLIVTADHETGGFTLATDTGDYNKIKPSFSTTGHSATLIPIFAKGPGAGLFGGVYENTGVFHKIMELLETR